MRLPGDAFMAMPLTKGVINHAPTHGIDGCSCNAPERLLDFYCSQHLSRVTCIHLHAHAFHSEPYGNLRGGDVIEDDAMTLIHPHQQVGPSLLAVAWPHPIGIFHAPMMHTQEANSGRGIPLLHAALFPTIDAVAKLTTLWQNGGQRQGPQLLHAAKIAEVPGHTFCGDPLNFVGQGRDMVRAWRSMRARCNPSARSIWRLR